MLDKITFFGSLTLKDGKAYLEIPEKHLLAQQAIEALGDGPVRITITHDDKGKESGLLRYYWSVMLPAIALRFQELGNDWDEAETHRQLKKLFPQHFKPGKEPSIKSLSKQRFRRYVQDVHLFAAEFLCISVSEPVTLQQNFPQHE